MKTKITMTTLPIKSLVAGCFALTITQPAVAYNSCCKGAGRYKVNQYEG